MFSTIAHRDSSCTASDFYRADNPSGMCGPSTFSSLTDDHCRTGDASLVDDCHKLIADLEALGGGGFWGWTQKGILVVASQGTCTFNIEKGESYEFAIGTQNMTGIITSSMAISGVPQECNG